MEIQKKPEELDSHNELPQTFTSWHYDPHSGYHQMFHRVIGRLGQHRAVMQSMIVLTRPWPPTKHSTRPLKLSGTRDLRE